MMKYIVYVLLGLFLFQSCKTTAVYPTANVTFQSVKNGVIQARCIGLGEDEQAAINDAEKNMVRTLLFRGLPGSGQEAPLLSIDEAECEQKYPDYMETLFSESSMRYKSFLQSSIPVSDLQNHGKGVKSIAVDVKVNLKALRLDLEKQGLIRRFGY